MCEIRYRNSVYLKVLVSSFNMRGRGKTLRRVYLLFGRRKHLRFDEYTWDMMQRGQIFHNSTSPYIFVRFFRV